MTKGKITASWREDISRKPGHCCNSYNETFLPLDFVDLPGAQDVWLAFTSSRAASDIPLTLKEFFLPQRTHTKPRAQDLLLSFSLVGFSACLLSVCSLPASWGPGWNPTANSSKTKQGNVQRVFGNQYWEHQVILFGSYYIGCCTFFTKIRHFLDYYAASLYHGL